MLGALSAPSLLLIATLYRLALNVAATRLILTGADAGEVIGSIGEFAVQGNFVVGLVVFAILVVVQYVVITSGAQRVSEVAARFTLDSMPGQQMSIDADLNMGLIDQKEAILRREGLQKEANFYGAMDGAGSTGSSASNVSISIESKPVKCRPSPSCSRVSSSILSKSLEKCDSSAIRLSARMWLRFCASVSPEILMTGTSLNPANSADW